jgi:hypothetical protein
MLRDALAGLTEPALAGFSPRLLGRTQPAHAAALAGFSQEPAAFSRELYGIQH